MTGTKTLKVLLIGYGNPGRLDDGLGPAVAAAFEGRAPGNVTVEANYQLTVEDAAQIAEHDVVIFADASVNAQEPFTFTPVVPKLVNTFSTHSLEPEIVMGFAEDLFQSKAKGYALGVRGYEFNEFGEKLSSKAQDNLIAAVEFLTERFARRDFDRFDR